MKIRKLAVHNFRLILDLEMECRDLIPRLNGGYRSASNLLGAVEFALRVGSEAGAEDFCPFRDPSDNDMWVELTLADLTRDERQTFGPYIASDGSITIRKTATLLTDGTAEVAYAA